MTRGDPDQSEVLLRIAAALERLSPQPCDGADWLHYPAYVWEGERGRGLETIEAPALNQLRGIDRQRDQVVRNVGRLAAGHSAHDMLLWGARGMGKSALLRSAVLAAQADAPDTLAMVQVGAAAIDTLPVLFADLRTVNRRFLVFLDDLGFAEDDTIGPRRLRSWLEGGVEARPATVRLAVTSNHRAILARQMSEQDDPISTRDAADDQLALADRFGMSLGFHKCSQDTYLEIVQAYAVPLGIDFTAAEAIEFAARRGSRSGRVAWQFVTEIAGRAGKTLTL